MNLTINKQTIKKIIYSVFNIWTGLSILLIILVLIYWRLNDTSKKTVDVYIETIFTEENDIYLSIDLDNNPQNNGVKGEENYIINHDWIQLFIYGKLPYKSDMPTYTLDNRHITLQYKDSVFLGIDKTILEDPANKSINVRPIVSAKIQFSDDNNYTLEKISNAFDNTFGVHETYKEIRKGIFVGLDSKKIIYNQEDEKGINLKYYYNYRSDEDSIAFSTMTTYGNFFSSFRSKFFINLNIHHHNIATYDAHYSILTPEIYNPGSNESYNEWSSNRLLKTKNINGFSIHFNNQNTPLAFISISPEPDQRTSTLFSYNKPEKIEMILESGISVYADNIKVKDVIDKMNIVLATILGGIFSLLAGAGLNRYQRMKRKKNE